MKPYIVRALYEWCANEGFTPYLVVKVDEYCQVPRALVKEGYITLNISDRAVKNLLMDNQWIEFTARFSGVVQQVIVPMSAVAGLYSRESQEGMGFETTDYVPEEADDETVYDEGVSSSERSTSDESDSKGPTLKILD